MRKEISPLRWQLNSISRAVLFLAGLAVLLLVTQGAGATQLSVVYLSACRREVGVMLKVDRRNVHMLGLDGTVRGISRFDVIYLAFYPVGEPPMDRVAGNEQIEVVTVSTIFDGRESELVRGWMVDYSHERISFLTTEGSETVIDINDIWDIEMEAQPETIRFGEKPPRAYRFVHPYPFVHCGYGDESPSAAEEERRTIFPQTQLGDPLLIKAELDRLEQGYERAAAYQASKKYYPVPQIYANRTLLGVSLTGGSRHGESGSRKTSFIPVLRSGLSEGPFGFQRVWVAGAAPMPYGIHEEPQTQLHYRLKADYLHFTFMFDPNLLIIGSSNYKWKIDDLNGEDDRWNDTFHIGGGFDYGAYAFELSLAMIRYAVRSGQNFFEETLELPKLGFVIHRRSLKAEFYLGSGSDKKPTIGELAQGNSEEDLEDAAEELASIPEFHTKLRFFRLNLELPATGGSRLRYSLIYRETEFERLADLRGGGAFQYSSSSLTNAAYQDFPLSQDLTLSVFLSVEVFRNRFGDTGLDGKGSSTFLKGGAALWLRL